MKRGCFLSKCYYRKWKLIGTWVQTLPWTLMDYMTFSELCDPPSLAFFICKLKGFMVPNLAFSHFFAWKNCKSIA